MKNNSRLKDHVAPLVIILFIVFLSFSPALKNGFTCWDEEEYLLNNSYIRSLNIDNIREIFFGLIFKTYSPLTVLSFAVEYHFFKFDPFIYHLTNILLHLGVVLLTYLFSLQCGISRTGAVFTALLFGIHPIHVESVAWIVERKDVLFAFFYMTALCTYSKYTDTHQSKFLWISWLASLLSILSKAMAASLPLVLLLLDWYKSRNMSRKVLMEKIPYFLFIIPVAFITYFHNKDLVESSPGPIILWVWSFAFYILKFIFPLTLLPIYTIPQPINILSEPYLLSVIFISVIVFCVIRTHDRLCKFAFGFCFLSLLLVLKLQTLNVVTPVADRFMYLSCLGFCMWLSVNLEKFIKIFDRQRPFMKWGVILLIVSLFVALSLKTFYQCQIWRDASTLWSYVLKEDPRQPRAYDNLAVIYLKEKDYGMALGLFKKAEAIEGPQVDRLANFGIIFHEQGDLVKAEQYFRQALIINPQYYVALNQLGLLLWQKGARDEARTLLKKAVLIRPHAFEARMNLAGLSFSEGSYQYAENLYRENLKMDPDHSPSLLSLMWVYFSSGDQKSGLMLCPKVLSRVNDHLLLNTAAVLLADKGYYPWATLFFKKSLMVNAAYKDTYINFGMMYGNQGQYQEAINLWKKGKGAFPEEKIFDDLIEKANALADDPD